MDTVDEFKKDKNLSKMKGRCKNGVFRIRQVDVRDERDVGQ